MQKSVFFLFMGTAIVVLLISVYASFKTGHKIGFKAGQIEAETYYTWELQTQTQEYEADLASEESITESVRKALQESLDRESVKEAEARELSEELAIVVRDLEEARTFDGLVQFESKMALHAWLQDNPVSTREYIDGKYVCSHFALDLCIDAWNDGYIMGLSRISDQRHQKCFTIIGKTVYEIEAITDGVREVGWVY